MTNSEPLLKVENLTVSYTLGAGLFASSKEKFNAVDGVSFEISKGEIVGLVGESGSGKTTTGRAIIRLAPVSGGKIIYGGEDISKLSDRAFMPYRKKIQMIFQDPYASLNPRWTVEQLIAEPLVVLGITQSKEETAERVQQALHRVRMKPDDAKKYPHQFSGGQRQRIAVARALASRPEFIICDEPTSALDVSVQAQVLNLMRDLQEEFGLTYLLISHNLAVIRHMCDDIGVMQRGQLVEVGDAQAVLDDPQHQYTKDLMAASPDSAHVH